VGDYPRCPCPYRPKARQPAFRGGRLLKAAIGVSYRSVLIPTIEAVSGELYAASERSGWLQKGTRPPVGRSSRRGTPGALRDTALVPVPPVGKDRAGRACGLCNVSDCSPVAALRLWQRATEGEFYGELSTPATIGVSGLTFVAVSRCNSGCLHRAGAVGRLGGPGVLIDETSLLPGFAHRLSVEGVEDSGCDEQYSLVDRPRYGQGADYDQRSERPGDPAVSDEESRGANRVGEEGENPSHGP